MDLALLNLSQEASQRLTDRLGPDRMRAIVRRNQAEQAVNRHGAAADRWLSRGGFSALANLGTLGLIGAGMVSSAVALPALAVVVSASVVSMGLYGIHELQKKWSQKTIMDLPPDYGHHANEAALAVLRARPSLTAAMASCQPASAVTAAPTAPRARHSLS